MGEPELLQALILGFIAIITTSAMAGGAAAYTFKGMAKTVGDSIDRWMKTAEERDEEAKAKNAERDARAELNIKLSEAIASQAVLRNELTVVSQNAAQMDEAVRQMGIRLTAVENEKMAAERRGDQLEVENELLKAENTQLKAERESLGQEVKELQTQVNELKEKVARLETQHPPDTTPAAAESLDHVAQLTSAGVAGELNKKPEGNDPL